ncbi:MAG: putative toxin-antitoxin system toxin component, PIN family [Elusimicrobiota bacterium]|nr:putative toxin-antitoxin system toxin component, PIN family [Elusimicrobiota bacterium]
MLKVVIDTNQFVSAVISRKGASAQLLKAWQNCLYTLVTSKKIIKEIKRVFEYPHIAKKYHLKKKDTTLLISLVEHEAAVLSDSLHLNVIKDDPDDNKFLACAVEANANYIVSGDKHLLNLRHYKNISVVTVRKFLEILKQQSSSR